MELIKSHTNVAKPFFTMKYRWLKPDWHVFLVYINLARILASFFWEQLKWPKSKLYKRILIQVRVLILKSMVHLPNFKCNNSKELRKSISYFACKTIASRFYDDKLIPDPMTLLVYMSFTALRILTVHHNSNNLGHILDIKKNEAKKWANTAENEKTCHV